MQEVTELFLLRYAQLKDFYERAAALCHEQCRDVLLQNGIRHLVTYRAKRKDRLKAKISSRELEGKVYRTESELIADLVDLAGVRVALYFPGDRQEAINLLSQQFDLIKKPKYFQGSEARRGSDVYRYRFPGYSATHLRVRLKSEFLEDDNAHYAEAGIEVQIASLVMHAWAEVEHDLVYKPLQGEVLSETEYALLDQVNGLAYSGEIALEQLQAAIKGRLARGQARFQNHYELAAHIHSALSLPLDGQFLMGRVDLLLHFLSRLELDRSDKLSPYLDPSAIRPSDSVADQVVRQIAQSSPTPSALIERWQELLQQGEPADAATLPSYSEEEIRAWAFRDSFLTLWRSLDQATLRAQSLLDPGRSPSWVDFESLRRSGRFEPSHINLLRQARSCFFRLAQGESVAPTGELTELAGQMKDMITWLYSEFPEALSDLESTPEG